MPKPRYRIMFNYGVKPYFVEMLPKDNPFGRATGRYVDGSNAFPFPKKGEKSFFQYPGYEG